MSKIYCACPFSIQVQTVNTEAFCGCETLIFQLQEDSMSPCEGSRRQRLRIDVGQTCCKNMRRKIYIYIYIYVCVAKVTFSYRDADKSLARPGRKQARKHVTEARDFDNIETRAIIKFFFFARRDAEGNSHHSGRNISLFACWSG